MRAIKLSVVLLFSLTLLLILNGKLLDGFVAAGQVSTLSPPTNVIASDNAYATKVTVAWDTIRGATLYRIFRNASNDPASAVSLGTTAEGTFFDASGVANQNYF